MALAIGVAALFFGVVFIIVGWKGGGTTAMNTNLAGMMKGEYLPVNNPGQTSALDTSTSKPKSTGATSTTGGANSSGKK